MHAIFHAALAAFAQSEEKKKKIFFFKFNLCVHAIENYRMLYSQKIKFKRTANKADFLKSPISYNMGNKAHMIGLKHCVL